MQLHESVTRIQPCFTEVAWRYSRQGLEPRDDSIQSLHMSRAQIYYQMLATTSDARADAQQIAKLKRRYRFALNV